MVNIPQFVVRGELIDASANDKDFHNRSVATNQYITCWLCIPHHIATPPTPTLVRRRVLSDGNGRSLLRWL
jgi:hypothetical protein